MRCSVGLLGGFLAAAAPSPAAMAQASAPPTADALDSAKKYFDDALAHYRAGEYREAVDDLERALELDPDDKDLVYNLALVHEKLGQLREAIGYFRRYLGVESDAAERERVEATILRLEGALEAGGQEPPAEHGLLAEWKSNDAPASEEEETTPSRIDGWVLGTGGLALAAFAVGTVFGVRALATQPSSDDRTGVNESHTELEDRQKRAHGFAVVADVAFAVALVSGGAAVTLYLSRAPDGSAGARPGRRFVGLSAGGRF